MFESSVRHDLAGPLRMLPPGPRARIIELLTRPRIAAPRSAQNTPPATPAAFQRRRDYVVDRLNAVDRVIAMSNRVAEIYEQLGVAPERLTTMQLTLEHIDRLTPRRRSPGNPLTFATLGGGESVAKGTAVLLQAVKQLSREVGPEDYRLLVFGRCERTFEGAIREFPAVERRPPYRPEQLNGLLEEVDVGIMPSIWEEAYGYAGIEFLAKGIPVITNPIGGMPDYVVEGQTGWFNRVSSGHALAETMCDLIERPERVAEVTRATRAARDELVITIAKHTSAMEDLYRDVGAAD